MANSLGQLLVKLGLDAAEFTTGLTKSEYEAQKSAQAITRSLNSIHDSIRNIVGAIGVGFGVHEMVEWGKSILDNAEQMRNLQEETGASIESISRLENAAKLSGGTFEYVRNIVDKFSAGLGHADDGSNKVRNALNALGVTARDPVKAIEQAAIALDKFGAGANKAAFAKDLFGGGQGVGGIQFIGALNQLADGSAIVATKTDEQVRKATELLEAYRRLEIESHALRDAFLEIIVPALTDVVKAFNDARVAGDGFLEGLKIITQLSPFKSAAENVGYLEKQVKELEDTISSVKSGESLWVKLGISSKDTTNLEANLKTAKEALGVAYQAQLRALGGGPTNAGGLKPQAPPPPVPGQAEAIARQTLEARIKADEQIIKEAEKTQQGLLQISAAYYASELTGIREYYAEVKRIDDDAATKKKSALDDEIAALRDFANKTRKPEERVRVEGQIAEAITKRADIDRDAAVKSTLSNLASNEAAKKYLLTVDTLAASLAQLRDDTVSAANIGFAVQYQEQLDKARANLNSPDADISAGAKAAEARIKEIGRLVDIQARLNKATQEYSLTLDELGVAQQHIANLADSGAITELDALRQKSDATQSYIGALKAELAAVEAVAIASGKREDLVRVAQLKVALEGLEMQGDLVVKKFKDIFENDAVNALDEFVLGTKSAKEAFSDFAKSIERDLTHIANQQIIKALANSLFGAGSSGGGAGLIGSLLGSLLGSDVGALAGGTDYARGGMTLVGERGPELVNMPRGAQVIPNDVLMAKRAGRSVTVHNNFAIYGPADARTQNQIALAASRGVRSATARDA